MVQSYINFVEFEAKNLKQYTIIEGFPGMGLVGTISAKYIIEKLKFKYYGYIDSNIFMPVIRIHRGMPVRPARIYIHDGKKLIVLVSEQVIPRIYVDKMAKAVVEWIQKKGITKLISLSGINAVDSNQKTIIYGIAANEKSLETLKGHSLEIIEDGITTGVTALILLDLINTNVEAISILGNVRIAADYQAAAEVIKKLNDVIGLNIDVQPLLKEAQLVERELIKHLQNVQETKDSVERFEGKTPPMYA